MENHAIDNEADHRAALKIVSALVDADPKLGTSDGDRLEVLGTLVEVYEATPQADIPMTGLSTYIANLAKQHGVVYVKTGSSALAQVITRLAGDDGNPDEPEKLVIALRRANVINGRIMVTLLGRYFDETRHADRA
jgi:antitoxin component HigA of HigAB toxin-antitoxin module